MPDSERAALTPRETEIMLLVAGGLQSKEIAQRLCISPKTVDNHIDTVRMKVGAQSRREAARLVMLPPEPFPRVPEAVAIAPESDRSGAAGEEASETASNLGLLPVPAANRTYNDLPWQARLAWPIAIAISAMLILLGLAYGASKLVSLIQPLT
jgi:DNA-binding CsgD family transcriptional regulator